MYVTPETMRECLTKLSETGLIRPLPEAPKKLEALTQAWREGIIPNATDANMRAAVSYLMQEEETGGSYVTVARFNKALRVVRQRAASARNQIIKGLEESDTGVLADLTMNDTADEALEEHNQYAGLLYQRAARMAAAGGASKRGIERAGAIAVQRFNEGGALKSLHEHFQDVSEAISGGTFLSPNEAPLPCSRPTVSPVALPLTPLTVSNSSFTGALKHRQPLTVGRVRNKCQPKRKHVSIKLTERSSSQLSDAVLKRGKRNGKRNARSKKPSVVTRMKLSHS